VSPKLKSAIQYTAIFLVGILFLYFVFNGTDWNDMFEKFKRANYSWIAAGMVISLLSHFLRAYRAVMLYDALNYKVPVKNSFYAVLIGYMMNYIIPRAGEVSRCAALSKTDDIPVDKSLGTVVTERIFDMVMLLLLIGLVFILQFDMLMNYINGALDNGSTTKEGISLKWILLAVMVVGGAAFFALRSRLKNSAIYAKMMNVLKGFSEGLLSIRNIKNPLWFIVLSLAIWGCYLLMMYFCFFAMEATQNLDFNACLTVFALGTIGMVIPAPGAGAGTYHFAIMQSLFLFGVPLEDGKAYATIVHGMQMIILLALGALASLAVLAMHKKKSTEQIPA
jgi:uncharacterized membrane protein YbhN (UPF0104 family)